MTPRSSRTSAPPRSWIPRPSLATRLKRATGMPTLVAVVATVAATLAVLTLLGCRDATEIPEAGAVMLRINAAPTGERPTELRVWAYADEGVIFDGTRFPDQGSLPATVGTILGSILVNPGNVTGNLRVYVRGLDSNAITVETGAVILPPAQRNRTTVDVFLDSPSLHDADTDGDGVPDEVDDCPTVSDPAQLGCPPAGTSPDAGPGSGGTTTPADASSSGSGTGGGGTGPSATGGEAHDAAIAVSTGGNGAAGVTDGGAPREDRPFSVDAPAADAPAAPVDAGAPDLVTPPPPADGAAGELDATIPLSKGLGSPCQTNVECRSLFCADGVCCNAACNQPCQACVFGFCLAVVRRPDPPQCAGTMTCNQAAMCVAGP